MNTTRKLVEVMAMGGYDQSPEEETADNDPNLNVETEESMESYLQDRLPEIGIGVRGSFRDVGIRSRNNGLVIKSPSGKASFALTIVKMAPQ